MHHPMAPSLQIQARLFTGVTLFMIAGILAACTKTEDPASKNKGTSLIEGIEVGNLAPDFTIKQLEGGQSSLSEYKGKVVLINFWATWCGPCKAEMPSMELLYQTYPRDDFEILAVSIDIDPNAPVKEFIQDFGFTFPVLLDNQFIVNERYQVRVVPTSVVLDRRGVITHRLLGAKDWNDPDAIAFVDKLVKADI
ncbi:MAG: TlpA disulfide reductase family protein [Nitrospiria bacterium]